MFLEPQKNQSSKIPPVSEAVTGDKVDFTSSMIWSCRGTCMAKCTGLLLLFEILLLPSALPSWIFVCVLSVFPIKTHIYEDDSHHSETFFDKNAMESTTTFSICVDVFNNLAGILNGSWKLYIVIFTADWNVL